MTLATVIVPTYNRRATLERALRSLEAQTYPSLEIVVVDDGSTDGTRGYVERFAAESRRRVRFLSQANSGCATARNQGLRVAAGGLIAFLDSDDEWLPTAAESLAHALESSGADFVYSPAVEVLADGREKLNCPIAAHQPDLIAIEHFKNTNVRNGAFMVRRRVLARVPGFDESLDHNEDSDFFQRVAITHVGTYSTTPTVRVHHHAGNKSIQRASVYAALLISAQRILAEYPTFATTLGGAADARTKELTRQYVDALVRAGDYDRAREVKAGASATIGWTSRAALRVRSPLPVRIRDHFRARRTFEDIETISGSVATPAKDCGAGYG